MVVPVFPSLTAGFISVFIDKTTIKELCNNVVTYNFFFKDEDDYWKNCFPFALTLV